MNKMKSSYSTYSVYSFMTVLNFAQWAVTVYLCDVIIAVHEYNYNITLSDRWYIAILAYCYSCIHEGGRCLSMGVFRGEGDFLLLGHLNLLKLHRKYSIFDSYWKNFEALQTTTPSGRFCEVLSLLYIR